MKKHVVAFDGLRTLAVYGVVVYHCGYLRAGGVGLDIFFPLSGFLITSILLSEYRAGRWSLMAFYVRRLRRLYPALILVLLVTLPFGALLDSSWWRYLESCGIAGFYLSDVIEQHNPHFLGGLAHTWSLAVEEQFYLLWPLCLSFLLRRGRERLLVPALVLGFTLMSGAMIVTRLDFLPFTHGGALLAGCLVAVLLERNTVPAPRIVSAVSFAGLIALMAFGAGDSSPPGTQITSVGTCVIVCVLIAGLMEDGGIVARVLSWRPLTWIGERAYGIYLWHFPILLALNHDHLGAARNPWYLAITLVASTAAAAFSARYVEARFRRYSANAAPVRAQPHAPAAGRTVTVGAAMASGSAPQLTSS